MHILYTLNDKFVPQVATCICSICENNKEEKNITFHLFSLGITEKNKKKLTEFVKSYKYQIKFYELEDLSTYFDFQFDTNGWNPIVLARLLIDKILPKEINRVIYLDGDTITLASILELWNTDMKNKVIGASIEPTVDKERKKSLGLLNSNYYNAGVLLINLDLWRKNNTGEKIINYYKEKKGQLFANDQDAINGALKDEIYTLSPKYNFFNTFIQYPYHFLEKLELPATYISKKIFDDAKKNPCIIHFLGEERPWRKYNTHKYSKEYKKYLSITPWKDTEDEEGWHLYFICWKIFNTITKPFPSLRYNIINKLIPIFMKYRSNKLKKSGEK